MNIHTATRHAAVFLLVAASSRAVETPATAKPTDDDLRIRGVFNSELPRTEYKHSLRLIVHPHLGDLTKRNHLRTVLGFRYGLTSRWEASTETDAYFSHGLKGTKFFDEAGFATLRFGTKYQIGDPLALGWDTSVGVNWQQPMGTPPVDVTDGLRHFAPFVAASHQLEGAPAWRVFTGFGWDNVAYKTAGSSLEKNELRENSLNFSGGALFEHGPATYALEATYTTTRLIGTTDRDVFALRPSILWVLPPRFTFGSNSKWVLGFGLRLSHGPDGNDLGVNAKLRVNFDFKRLLGLKSAAPAKP